MSGARKCDDINQPVLSVDEDGKDEIDASCLPLYNRIGDLIWDSVESSTAPITVCKLQNRVG